MRTFQFIYPTIFSIIFFYSCDQINRYELGKNYAEEQLKSALADTLKTEILTDTVIADKKTAIAVAEAILFKIYSKKQIIEERPYEIYFIDSHWILMGTSPTRKYARRYIFNHPECNGWQSNPATHGK